MRAFAALTLLAACAAGCSDPAPQSSSRAPAEKPASAPSGAGAETAAIAERAPYRGLGVLDSRVYVRTHPRATSTEIGVLHVGAVVTLRSDAPVSTDGCQAGWYAIEPEGFVCLDTSTTLDLEHPVLVAKREHHGDFASTAPFRWSESREALLYRKLPSADEQRRTEFELDKHLERHDVARAEGAVPSFLADGALSPWALSRAPGDRRPRAKWIPTRSAIAWTNEFFAEGRSWVLTDELLIAPKDKLEDLSVSTFAGALVDGENVRLPLVFIRHDDKPKFRLAVSAPDTIPVGFAADSDGASVEDSTASDEPPVGDREARDRHDPLEGFSLDTTPGTLVPAGDAWPRLSRLGLTGRFRKHKGVRYLETSERGSFVREHDATLVQAEPPRGFELANDEKWIDVSIFRGTLVAYEGRRAVFATLISPGANGYKREEGARAKYTTPTGTFRIEWKHRSTTMTPDPERRSYSLAEVPHTQFFHVPFALHAAYWHDRFGEPRSGGCVNLSPADAKWLFEWTEPTVPDTWHAVRSGDFEARKPGTWVRIR